PGWFVLPPPTLLQGGQDPTLRLRGGHEGRAPGALFPGAGSLDQETPASVGRLHAGDRVVPVAVLGRPDQALGRLAGRLGDEARRAGGCAHAQLRAVGVVPVAVLGRPDAAVVRRVGHTV